MKIEVYICNKCHQVIGDGSVIFTSGFDTHYCYKCSGINTGFVTDKNNKEENNENKG